MVSLLIWSVLIMADGYGTVGVGFMVLFPLVTVGYAFLMKQHEKFDER